MVYGVSPDTVLLQDIKTLQLSTWKNQMMIKHPISEKKVNP